MVLRMKKKGRTYEWRDNEIVESKPNHAESRQKGNRRPPKNSPKEPPKRSTGLGVNQAILLFAGSLMTLLVCIPLLIALLYVMWALIFG